MVVIVNVFHMESVKGRDKTLEHGKWLHTVREKIIYVLLFQFSLPSLLNC